MAYNFHLLVQALVSQRQPILTEEVCTAHAIESIEENSWKILKKSLENSILRIRLKMTLNELAYSVGEEKRWREELTEGNNWELLEELIL